MKTLFSKKERAIIERARRAALGDETGNSLDEELLDLLDVVDRVDGRVTRFLKIANELYLIDMLDVNVPIKAEPTTLNKWKSKL